MKQQLELSVVIRLRVKVNDQICDQIRVIFKFTNIILLYGIAQSMQFFS